MTNLGDRPPVGRDEPGDGAAEQWDGDQSWWSDDLHIPYVPPREVLNNGDGDSGVDRWDEPSPPPDRGEFRYHPAPAGSSRRDRREHRQGEGERIADLLATVQRPHRSGVPVSAPRGLGRRGRKAFYAARSEHVQDRRRRAAGNLSEREVGILALVVVVAVAVLVRVVFFNDPAPSPAPTAQPAAAAPVPQTVTRAPATPSTTTATAAVPVAVDPALAVAAAAAWFTVTCPLPPSQWGPARGLMTTAAWAAVDPAPPVVTATWVCENLDVRAAPDQGTAPPGGVTVRMDADRTITTGSTPVVTEKARTVRVVVPVGGRWLIDRGPAN